MKSAVLTGEATARVSMRSSARVVGGEQHGLEVMGIREGWRGCSTRPCTIASRASASGILHLGAPSRHLAHQPFKKPAMAPTWCSRTSRRLNVGAVVAIGGRTRSRRHQSSPPWAWNMVACRRPSTTTSPAPT